MRKLKIALIVSMISLVWQWAAARDTWCVVTDGGTPIAIYDIECLISTDGEQTFSLLKSNGTKVQGINRLTIEVRDMPEQGGMSDISADSAILVMHNTVKVTNARYGATITVTSVDGRKFQDCTVNGPEMNMDISALPAGYYLLSVNGLTVKFVKQ